MLMLMPLTITMATVTSSDKNLYAATSAQMPVAMAETQHRVLDVLQLQ